MQNITDLDNSLQGLTDAVTTAESRVNVIATPVPTLDLSPQIDKVNAITQRVANIAPTPAS